MNINSDTGIKIPGLPATLYVDTQYSMQDVKISTFLVSVWRFYNEETNKSSLINRVELWKDHTCTFALHVHFHHSGCEEMQRALKPYNVKFIHYHEENWCKFLTSDHKTIKGILTHLNRDHKMIGTTKGVINGIRSKL